MRAARICLLATVALVAPSAFAQEVPIAPAPPPIGGTAEQSGGNPAVAS